MHLHHAKYLQHFHLTAEPFSLTPDPEFLYLSPAHAEALAALTLGVTGRNGLVVMSGEVGTGKTTLVYSLLRTIGDGMRTAFVSHSGLGFDGLLRLALTDFGVTSPSPSRFDMLATLNAMLRECASQGRTALLIVDEAHHLTDDDFEQLRLLSNFETFTQKLLQIVLVGQPELEARLRTRALRALTERVAVHCQLAPLGWFESRAYADYRLLRAGGSSRLFEPAARDLLLRCAQGVPRRINILCHNALLFAYGRGEAHVTVSCAQAAIEARAALMDLPDLSAEAGPATTGVSRRRLAIATATTAVVVAALVGGVRATAGRHPTPVSQPAPVAAPIAAPAADPAVVAAPPDEDESHIASAAQPVGAADPAPAGAVVADASEAHAAPDAPRAETAPAAPPDGDAPSSAELALQRAGVAAVAEPSAPAPAASTEPAASAGDTVPDRQRTVRVQSGQTLAALARSVYGGVDPDIIRRIQNANPQIVDPDRILAGDLLRFPDDRPDTRGSEGEHLP